MDWFWNGGVACFGYRDGDCSLISASVLKESVSLKGFTQVGMTP
jgi:hypothetical protein